MPVAQHMVGTLSHTRREKDRQQRPIKAKCRIDSCVAPLALGMQRHMQRGLLLVVLASFFL